MGDPAWPVYKAADADSLGFCVLPGPQLPSSALKARPCPSAARPSHSRLPSGPLSTLAGMESELAGGSEHRPPSCYHLYSQSHQERRLGNVHGVLVSPAAVPRRADGSVTGEPGQGMTQSSAGPQKPKPALHTSHLETPSYLSCMSAQVPKLRLVAQVLGLLESLGKKQNCFSLSLSLPLPLLCLCLSLSHIHTCPHNKN